MSCAVLTLNEEDNIAECIESAKMAGTSDVVVYDGGSTDRTVEIARVLGCRAVVVSGSSIAERRSRAITDCRTAFVLFLDADQRLEILDLNELVERYFDDPSVAGIQFCLRATEVSNYWERGFSRRHEIITGTPGPRAVIGTPCIFRVSEVRAVGYDVAISGGSDDTALGHMLRARGFILLAVPERASEAVRATFAKTIRKAYWYGLSDSEFFRLHPDRRRNHAYHVLVRNGVSTPARTLVREPSLFPFFQLFGLARAAGFCAGMLDRRDLSSTRS